MEAALLHCPIRGALRTRQRAADTLTFTEEKHRIDAIRYLLQRRYPRENFGIETTLFRLGRDGRNSFRTDFAIYDCDARDLQGESVEGRLEHVRVLAEIKRDNSAAELAKATQVRAALQLVPDMDTLGVYWDDVEQRMFYRRLEGRRAEVREAPISKIPDWGNALGTTQLFYGDLDPAKDLVRVFDEIEDALHTYVVDKVERYTIIQQLLLTKIHDEITHRSGNRLSTALDFQDFSTEASDREVVTRLESALQRAAGHYNQYLGENKQIAEHFLCPPEALRNISKVLAPINVLHSKTQVIQAFYMKFAKSLYKWDLAQYFTPHEVIDFIVELTNPQPGEHVFDPACGSADFLISAFRKAGPTAENCVWGADNSEQATQISILNMVLNGDGKSQIATQDSLRSFSESSKKFSVVLCNPPFGTKIVERRYEVLRKFDMGHKWTTDDAGAVQTEKVRNSQQTGILFAELCVRQARTGGRIGIILPNGYLGNRSVEYLALREWLLRHTKVVAVMAFPRFTFKKSGADVSASVLILEKRAKPLARAADADDHEAFFGNIDSVGWRAGDKTAVPIYQRDPENGALILNEENEPLLDADFEELTKTFLRSPAPDQFPWTLADRQRTEGPQTAGIDIKSISRAPDLNLDPKRHSAKFRALRTQIESASHFRLGDALDLVARGGFKREPATIYRYVEIERIGVGEFDYNEVRGWELPDRAKLKAEPGDIFIPHVWGCAGKWFIAAGDCSSLVVTNGCTRLRVKPGCEEFLVDLAVGLSSEAFSVQMRALATGSDGLAEIGDKDLLDIVLPRIEGDELRTQVKEHVAIALSGDARLSKFARNTIASLPSFPSPTPRKSHVALV